MKTLDFIFYHDDISEADNDLSESIAKKIQNDINSSGGISEKPIQINFVKYELELTEDGDIDINEEISLAINKQYPNVIARQIAERSLDDEPDSDDIEEICSKDYISFTSDSFTSIETHPNLISLKQELCGERDAIEKVFLASFHPENIWYFYLRGADIEEHLEGEYESFDKTLEEMDDEGFFDDIELDDDELDDDELDDDELDDDELVEKWGLDEDALDEEELTIKSYFSKKNRKKINFVKIDSSVEEKLENNSNDPMADDSTYDIPKDLQNIIAKIKNDDAVIADFESGDKTRGLLMIHMATNNCKSPFLLLNYDPDDLEIMSAHEFGNYPVLYFSHRNEDIYLRMEDFINEFDYDFKRYKEIEEKIDHNDGEEIFDDVLTQHYLEQTAGILGVEQQKERINQLFISHSFEIIYLIQKTCKDNHIEFIDRQTFISDIIFGLNSYDGTNDKYLGISTNYSFFNNSNVEYSHYTYRVVPPNDNFLAFEASLVERLPEKKTADYNIKEKRLSRLIFDRLNKLKENPDTQFLKLFHTKQLRNTINVQEYESELKDADWDTINSFLATTPIELAKLIDVNYVYFDILEISRVSIEDNIWSCEMFMDLITVHDNGIDIIQFHNLSKKDELFKSELVSITENPDTPLEKSFRYLISANFEFSSIPDNYPFDEQLLSISYSTIDSTKYGLIQPTPLRKIDSDFVIQGWKIIDSHAGLARIKDKKTIGSALSQSVSIKEVTKIGWRLSRESSMSLIKILLPLAFLLSLNYYSLFVPVEELGSAMGILITVFLASIALYFSTERPQPLSMTIIDIIFASFYSITGIVIIFTIFAKLYTNLAFYLMSSLKLLIPLSFIFLGIYLVKRIKSKQYRSRLSS